MYGVPEACHLCSSLCPDSWVTCLTVSHLKRVITASSLPGSGLRSRWQAAGSVVLVGGWPPVSSCPGTSEGLLWLGFLGDFWGVWCGEGSGTPDWGALVLRCPLELPPSGPASTLSDFVCITHTEQKCRLPQGGASGLVWQCWWASDASLCPCSSQLSAMNTSQSFPSTACRLTPSGGLEASLASRWTGE